VIIDFHHNLIGCFVFSSIPERISKMQIYVNFCWVSKSWAAFHLPAYPVSGARQSAYAAAPAALALP
jgi:hypothetical protein